MNPYLTAFDLYHADGPPAWSWREAMEFHLQHGAVVATPRAFVMARRVRRDDPAEVLFSLSPLQSRDGLDCWHVWAAAGSMEALGVIAATDRAPFVSFLRRADLRPRIYSLARLLRHELESPETPAATRAACPVQRTGENGCGNGTAPPPGEAV